MSTSIFVMGVPSQAGILELTADFRRLSLTQSRNFFGRRFRRFHGEYSKGLFGHRPAVAKAMAGPATQTDTDSRDRLSVP